MTGIDCVVDNGTLLGECPLWSEDEQVLYWIDIDGDAVQRFDPSNGSNETRLMSGRPGSIALTTTAGVLLVSCEHQLGFLRWDSGLFSAWTDLEEAETGNRLNDGRCDPAGRFVVGSMWSDVAANRSTGMLHQVEPDGTSTTMRREIGVSNGIAFDRERSRFYFADSPTLTVWVSDYDATTGTVSNEREFFRYGDAAYGDIAGAPDGACIDAEGYYWSASVFGWAITRLDPDGKVDRQIEVPVQMPTMPAFGGPDLSTLYVTSIREGEARDGHVSGSLLAIETDVVGVADTPFSGVVPRFW